MGTNLVPIVIFRIFKSYLKIYIMKQVINVLIFAMILGFITLWAVMATDNPIWFVPIVLFGAALWHLLEVKPKQ